MEYLERFTSNPLLVIFVVLMLSCIIGGARRGMLKIIYGIISWVFLIWFVNFACGIVTDYLNVNTTMPIMVQETIATHLTDRYESSEQQEQGTGSDALMRLVPSSIQEKLDETIRSSVDATIQFISAELSQTAIHGIATIISILAGTLILFLLSKLIHLVGLVPGIRGVNRTLGVIAGFGEGLLFTWLAMYLADCFPTSDLGGFIIENTVTDPLLNTIYEMNIIERIIGI